MKFLLDTNILIPLEPLTEADVENTTRAALDFVRLVSEAGHQVFIHPEAFTDIGRNADQSRRKMRELQLSKYARLPDPPLISPSLERLLGHVQQGSNDWVDHALLSAVAADAVDYLVTEDQSLLRKAAKANLQDRVVSLADAADLLRTLLHRTPTPPPAVHSVKAHKLDERDPIFDSLRQDYSGFDNWLRKCKLEHRTAWTVTVGQSGTLAAVCLVNNELTPPHGLTGKVLKICTLKVALSSQGMRFGELLLKTVFDYASSNSIDWLFITTFPTHQLLIALLTTFGFTPLEAQTELGEMVMAKPLTVQAERPVDLTPLEYHVRYGPPAALWAVPNAFVIPIVPEYHRLLFPEIETQLALIPGVYPFGNSIRKAYLSHSACRSIAPGDNLLFYRSADRHAITVHGVAEATLRSASAEEIMRYVWKRSVYSLDDIERLCQKPVLAILFRQARILKTPLRLARLNDEQILRAGPQSIMKLREEAKQWVARQMDQ